MPSGTAAAILRFSSLGDVLLAAHLPCFLRRANPGRRIVFVTKDRYADVLRGHPEIARVLALAEGSGRSAAPSGAIGGLGDLIAALRREGIGEVFDVHGIWRSGWVARGLRGARTVRARRYGIRRRLMVHARWLRPAAVPGVLERYRALAGVPPDTELTSWLRAALSDAELERARAALDSEARGRGFLLLGVGSTWETKRWPLRHFVGLAQAAEREHGIMSRYAVAPDEGSLAAELRALLPAARREDVAVLPFRELAALGAHARAIVSNDSAVLHLGAALGIQAVGIFGSTVPEFGFARQGPRDQAVGIALGCRPCDVHGKRRCPLGHHACLERLEPAAVLAALARSLAPDARPLAGARA